MKNIIRKLLSIFDYEIRRINPFPAGSNNREVGDMKKLLEDLKVRGFNCKAVLDVGAHMGFWSQMAKEVYPAAKFCLIEPQFEVESLLKRFCDGWDDCTYVMAGAGAAKGRKTLTTSDDLSGASFMPKEDEVLKDAGNQRVIDIVTIDEVIKNTNFGIPDLAKLDVQGYELEALKGAESLFGKTEVFILEVSLFSFGSDLGFPVFDEVITFMLKRNYVVYDFPGFSRRPYDGALAQCDICFVKKDSFLRASNSWD